MGELRHARTEIAPSMVIWSSSWIASLLPYLVVDDKGEDRLRRGGHTRTDAVALTAGISWPRHLGRAAAP